METWFSSFTLPRVCGALCKLERTKPNWIKCIQNNKNVNLRTTFWTFRWENVFQEAVAPFAFTVLDQCKVQSSRTDEANVKDLYKNVIRWVLYVGWQHGKCATLYIKEADNNPVTSGKPYIHLQWTMWHVSVLHDRDLGWYISDWSCSKALSGQGGDEEREKTSKDKLPVGGMWLLPITDGICGVTYQGNGKYLTFNFLAVR